MLAAFQYYQGRIDDRKAESIALINQWQRSDAREAYAQLNAGLEQRLDAAGQITANLDPVHVPEFKFKLGRTVIPTRSSA